MKKLLLHACAFLAILGCGSDNANEQPQPYCEEPSGGYAGSYGSVTYGGQTYKTVIIGSQTWFADNLNYDVSGSRCYNNSISNCDKYGRLYDWSMAMNFDASCNENRCSDQMDTPHQGICPDGWHIPSNDEWSVLENYAGGSAGRYLKATTGWNSNGNGTDDYGFSALPGGYGDSDGNFSNVGYYGHWWSASENLSLSAYRWRIYYDSTINRYHLDKSSLFSVRCVQD